MFWNQVKKKKNRRKKERERFWNEVESSDKKERMEIIGIRVWWRKIKRKKK